MYIDFSNHSQLVSMMDNAKEHKKTIFAENENGETMQICIHCDYILTFTIQKNGWTRKNYYYRDGTTEELFER